MRNYESEDTPDYYGGNRRAQRRPSDPRGPLADDSGTVDNMDLQAFLDHMPVKPNDDPTNAGASRLGGQGPRGPAYSGVYQAGTPGGDGGRGRSGSRPRSQRVVATPGPRRVMHGGYDLPY